MLLLAGESPLLGLALHLVVNDLVIGGCFVRVVRRVLISWSRNHVRRRFVTMIKCKGVIKVGGDDLVRVLDDFPPFCFRTICSYAILEGLGFIVLSGQGNLPLAVDPLLRGYGSSFQSCCLALFHPIFFGFGEDAAGLAGDAARVRFLFEEAVGWGRVGGDAYKIMII